MIDALECTLYADVGPLQLETVLADYVGYQNSSVMRFRGDMLRVQFDNFYFTASVRITNMRTYVIVALGSVTHMNAKIMPEIYWRCKVA